MTSRGRKIPDEVFTLAVGCTLDPSRPELLISMSFLARCFAQPSAICRNRDRSTNHSHREVGNSQSYLSGGWKPPITFIERLETANHFHPEVGNRESFSPRGWKPPIIFIERLETANHIHREVGNRQSRVFEIPNDLRAAKHIAVFIGSLVKEQHQTQL